MLEKTFERKGLCKAHRVLFCKIILRLLVDQESLLLFKAVFIKGNKFIKGKQIKAVIVF